MEIKTRDDPTIVCVANSKNLLVNDISEMSSFLIYKFYNLDTGFDSKPSVNLKP